MARVRVRIDRASATPPFEQLEAQIRRAIDHGSLAPGVRLPTIRAMAERTGLVPNTVAKAYRELEAAGYLEGRGRAGTFVPGVLPLVPEPNDALADAARRYLAQARRRGADTAAAIEAVRRAARP